jgi:hypothetical protein
MQDFYTSQTLAEAELDYRRRLLTSLRREAPIEPPRRATLRATVAEAFAHLALHLDGRSIGSVAAQHAPASNHSHRGAA